SLSAGDGHTSALALVDRYGFIRAMDTGVPDVGGQLPGPLSAQLDAAGTQLLAGHGEGWGAPQMLDSLRTLAAAGRSTAGGDAPAFSLRALDGSRLSLEELRGRPVVLNFWWAGCPACGEEMAVLQRFADSHPNVAVVLIDPVDGTGSARAFVESQHVRAPVLLDPDGHVAAAYSVAGYPTTVFVHPDGTIGSTYPGALTPGILAAHVSNLGAGPA
ncbi:MAG TPA: TlpA disulfide reductase family protein, partial [Candidatus Dormibacteraeota bacterium]|nr:TlpA disulfide reductase family protein [Candidatus Dormibacteraeota bacterium]